jgi:hypothetical protein
MRVLISIIVKIHLVFFISFAPSVWCDLLVTLYEMSAERKSGKREENVRSEKKQVVSLLL